MVHENKSFESDINNKCVPIIMINNKITTSVHRFWQAMIKLEQNNYNDKLLLLSDDPWLEHCIK